MRVNVAASGNAITGNGDAGLKITDLDGNNQVVMDIGTGILGASGNNSIYDNTNFDIDNTVAGTTITAENNWWGTATPAAGQFNGNVDYTPWLTSNPN
jgi:hypothetical protein